MVLIGAIPHTFGINTNSALVQVISGQTINEMKIMKAVIFTKYGRTNKLTA